MQTISITFLDSSPFLFFSPMEIKRRKDKPQEVQLKKHASNKDYKDFNYDICNSLYK